jgi:hypothetical protein
MSKAFLRDFRACGSEKEEIEVFPLISISDVRITRAYLINDGVLATADLLVNMKIVHFYNIRIQFPSHSGFWGFGEIGRAHV